jgi:general L-amino acid transport system substrate-binding protein
VIAAGVLGDADAVRFVPLTAAERFTALQDGVVDVLVRTTSWTASRDGFGRARFLFTTFYDGQGFLVPASSGRTAAADLAGATVCVLAGTNAELNLARVFEGRGIPVTGAAFQAIEPLEEAYLSGECAAWSADVSQLAVFKARIEAEDGPEQAILAETISREPTGPVVGDGDDAWAQAVEWSVIAAVQAWEFGLDSTTVTSYEGDDPLILRFLGEGGFDPGLGLDPDHSVTIVSEVGSYREIYARNLEPLGLPLEGTLNALWSDGGLMYAPPYR